MRFLLIGLCLTLAGCGAQTTGKNICPDIRIDVRDSSYVTISPGLETHYPAQFKVVIDGCGAIDVDTKTYIV